jgi:multisubunit Na+/H+ antiporter MnhG subunit
VNLTPLSIVAEVLLVIGAVLLLTGLVGLAHRLQRVGRSTH